MKKFESILKPYNILDRKERYIEGVKQKFNNSVIKGDVKINEDFYLDIDSKVEKIEGDVDLLIGVIPHWLSKIEIMGYLRMSSLGLVSLGGCPVKVHGDFWCDRNKLTSLDGSPEWVGGSFWCDGNNLTTLLGGPKFVGLNYGLSNEMNSLEGIPEIINGTLFATGRIHTLIGFPKRVKYISIKLDNNISISDVGSVCQYEKIKIWE